MVGFIHKISFKVFNSSYTTLYFSTINAAKSQTVRNENPRNSPKDPPNSDMKETGG